MGVLNKYPYNFLLLPSETTEPPLPATPLPPPHPSQLGFLWNSESVPWRETREIPVRDTTETLSPPPLPPLLSVCTHRADDHRVQMLKELGKTQRLAEEKPCTSGRKDSCCVLRGALEWQRQHHSTRRRVSEAMQTPSHLQACLLDCMFCSSSRGAGSQLQAGGASFLFSL